MISTILGSFRVGEIRKKLLFTAAMLGLYRLGTHIPAPALVGAAVVLLGIWLVTLPRPSVLAATRVGLHDAWNGLAAVLLGLAWCGLVVAWIAIRTSHEAVRNIAGLEI